MARGFPIRPPSRFWGGGGAGLSRYRGGAGRETKEKTSRRARELLGHRGTRRPPPLPGTPDPPDPPPPPLPLVSGTPGTATPPPPRSAAGCGAEPDDDEAAAPPLAAAGAGGRAGGLRHHRLRPAAPAGALPAQVPPRAAPGGPVPAPHAPRVPQDAQDGGQQRGQPPAPLRGGPGAAVRAPSPLPVRVPKQLPCGEGEGLQPRGGPLRHHLPPHALQPHRGAEGDAQRQLLLLHRAGPGHAGRVGLLLLPRRGPRLPPRPVARRLPGVARALLPSRRAGEPLRPQPPVVRLRLAGRGERRGGGVGAGGPGARLRLGAAGRALRRVAGSAPPRPVLARGRRGRLRPQRAPGRGGAGLAAGFSGAGRPPAGVERPRLGSLRPPQPLLLAPRGSLRRRPPAPRGLPPAPAPRRPRPPLPARRGAPARPQHRRRTPPALPAAGEGADRRLRPAPGAAARRPRALHPPRHPRAAVQGHPGPAAVRLAGERLRAPRGVTLAVDLACLSLPCVPRFTCWG